MAANSDHVAYEAAGIVCRRKNAVTAAAGQFKSWLDDQADADSARAALMAAAHQSSHPTRVVARATELYLEITHSEALDTVVVTRVVNGTSGSAAGTPTITWTQIAGDPGTDTYEVSTSKSGDEEDWAVVQNDTFATSAIFHVTAPNFQAGMKARVRVLSVLLGEGPYSAALTLAT